METNIQESALASDYQALKNSMIAILEYLGLDPENLPEGSYSEIVVNAIQPSIIHDLDDAQTQAALDVLAERHRQVYAEGWTPEHDDAHADGNLAMAAANYAHPLAADKTQNGIPLLYWPWAEKWWKPSDRRRNLVKAGALILAEIERIDRAAARTGAATSPALLK